MQGDPSLSLLAVTIQNSLAPVFLLSGVAAFLNVLHARLLRVIDRTRHLEDPDDEDAAAAAARESELDVLLVRRHWINRAITLCTVCAILISGVVALLFVGTFIDAHVGGVVAFAFIIAMLCLILGLLSFLREVNLAVRHFRRTVRPGKARLNISKT